MPRTDMSAVEWLTQLQCFDNAISCEENMYLTNALR